MVKFVSHGWAPHPWEMTEVYPVFNQRLTPEKWGLSSVEWAPHPWDMTLTQCAAASNPSFSQCGTSLLSLLWDEVYPAFSEPLIHERWGLHSVQRSLISKRWCLPSVDELLTRQRWSLPCVQNSEQVDYYFLKYYITIKKIVQKVRFCGECRWRKVEGSM